MPLAQCISERHELPLKNRAGVAEIHMNAQGQTFAQRQSTVLTRNNQCGDLFAGAFERHHGEKSCVSPF